jgi:hypothetical protein
VTYFWKAWEWAVTAKDIYLEILDWVGVGGVAALWPASLVAVWWFL